MKKLITLLLISFIVGQVAYSQYFQGSMTNVGHTVTFKMKPVSGDITTAITYIGFSFRYNVASTPAFTVNSITSNTTNFPGLSIQRLADNNDGTYNYINFVHNTATVGSKTYTSGTEYDVFSITLNGNPATANLELYSDIDEPNQVNVFIVVDGASNFFNPGAGDQLYGPGFYKTTTAFGTAHVLPLNNVPVPVKFLGFDVVKKNNSAVINWSVENETALTDKYIIESSINGISFTTLATVVSSYNGRGNNVYSFVQDNLSAVRNSGVIYYRIKQIDKGGQSVSTSIKNVRLDGKAFAVSAFPNPIKSFTKLTIDLLNESRIIISITDATGKQVKGMQIQGFKGLNVKDVNLSNLSSGNYMLKVQAGAEVRSLPLVKAN